MNCHDAKERLTEGRESAAVRRHLHSCGDCAAFAREAEGGGRELAEAFLAVAPAPGFEGRVAARLGETEISVLPRPRRLAVRAAAGAALLAAGVAWLLLRPGAPPPPSLPVSAHPPVPIVVLTEPEAENALLLRLYREGIAGETQAELRFAGSERQVPLEPRLEDALLRAWAMGARRAEITIGPEVPGREIALLLESLEKTGYAYDLLRRKP